MNMLPVKPQPRQLWWQHSQCPAQRRPFPRCAAAHDVPDTSQRRHTKRPKQAARRRSRAPPQPQAPPPIDRNSSDNLFLNPENFDFQQQMGVMQEAFSQMSESERQAFLEYLAEQEGNASREASSPPSFPRAAQQQQQQHQQDAARDAAAAHAAAAAARNKLLAKVWQLLLEALPKRDAALLTKALPRGWYGARDLTRRDIMEGLNRLTSAETKRLPFVLAQVNELQSTAGALAAVFEQEDRMRATRLRRLAAQKGLALPDEYDDGAEDEGAEGEGTEEGVSGSGDAAEAEAALPSNMAELLGVVQRRLQDQLRTIEAREGQPLSEADHPLQRVRLGPADLYDDDDGGGRGEAYSEAYGVIDRQQQPGASTSGGSSSSSSRSSGSNGVGGGGGGGGSFIPEALQERVGRMAAAYDMYVARRGWEVEMSRRESTEMRNLIRLHSELADLVAAAASPPRGPGGGELYGPAAAQYEQELQQRSEDLAAQVAALLQPEEKQRLQDPAARSVIRYLETQLMVADEHGETNMDLDEQAVTRLGQFMGAAVNWEAYRAFLDLYSGRHPELQLGTIMRAAGMGDGDEWWVKMPDYPFDPSDDDDDDDDSSETASSSSPSPRPEVDWVRVEAVASLDRDTLAFLTELEATCYSEETFMKWYFHPVLGPRIRSGSLLDPAAAAAAAASGAGGGVGAAAAAAAAAAGGGLGGSFGGGGGGGGGTAPGSGLDPATLLAQLLGESRAAQVPELLRQAMEEAAREMDAAGPGAGTGAGRAAAQGRGAGGPRPGGSSRAGAGAGTGGARAESGGGGLGGGGGSGQGRGREGRGTRL